MLQKSGSYFGRGYMPDKLVKHAATVYNRGN